MLCNTFFKKKETHNKLEERALVQTVTYEAENLGMRKSEVFKKYMWSDQYWYSE